jgi:hypothetical protein
MPLGNERKAAVVAVLRVGYTEKLSVVAGENENAAG